MTYAEGDVVKLLGERNKRYVVERIRLTGEVDVRGPRGLRTVLSDKIIATPHDAAPAIPSAAPPKRKGRR